MMIGDVLWWQALMAAFPGAAVFAVLAVLFVLPREGDKRSSAPPAFDENLRRRAHAIRQRRRDIDRAN